MSIETFSSTGRAYDASNTVCETGTVIVVESECVIGLAWAWPIAVTKEGGKLHELDWKGDTGIVRKVMVDAQISWSDVREAYTEARRREWPVAEWVEAVAQEREWNEVEED